MAGINFQGGKKMTNVNGVNAYPKNPEASVAQTEKNAKTNKTNAKDGAVKSETSQKTQTAEQAVVYEKSDNTAVSTNYNKEGKKIDAKTIEAMKRESEMQYSQMIETVRQMIAQQSKEAGGIPKEFDFFNKIPKTVEELNASKGFEKAEDLDKFEDHVGEDLNDPNSYWSAEKTAERIVKFAKTISGGDTKKYELLKGAIEDGFKIASSYFDEMPEITGKTHELVMKGLDEWAGKVEEPAETEPKKEAEATQAAAI